MEMNKNYFNELFSVNVNDKAKKKQNLTYLSWAHAWAEIKKVCPDATYKIYHRIVHNKVTITKHYDAQPADPNMGRMTDEPAMDIVETREVENEVNYFTDGNTCWVKASVTLDGLEYIEELPIMDNKNQPQYGGVTCTQVNKAIQRALTKAAARHGLGLYIYAGEDLPEESDSPINANELERNFLSLKNEIVDKLTKAFGSKDEEKINQFIIATFQGKRVSESTVEDYDKLVAAKQFLDTLK